LTRRPLPSVSLRLLALTALALIGFTAAPTSLLAQGDPWQLLRQPGHVVLMRHSDAPGSGGFGAVSDRDPAAIGRDLLDGYVSAAGAARDYGVTNPEALRQAAAAEDLP